MEDLIRKNLFLSRLAVVIFVVAVLAVSVVGSIKPGEAGAQSAEWVLEQTLTELDDPVATVAFSPDGNYVAYGGGGGSDNNVYVHALSDWSLEATLTEATDIVNSVAFSPNGDYIAYGSGDSDVYVHLTSNWSHDRTLSQTTSSISAVEFSPDNSYIAYGSSDNNVYIHSTSGSWDPITESPLTQAGTNVLSIAFSPDENYIAYGSAVGDVYIHSTSNWSHEQTLIESLTDVNSVVFSPNSQYIAYGTNDNNVYIHLTNNWEHEVTLNEAGGNVYSVSFSPDSNYIAYGAGDDRVYAHQVIDWEHETTLEESTDQVLAVSFSSDSQHIAYGGWDEDVYVHHVPEPGAVSVTLTVTMEEFLEISIDDASLNLSPDPIDAAGEINIGNALTGFNVSTNNTGGYLVTIEGLNNGLESTDASHTINTVTGTDTIDAGTEIYGALIPNSQGTINPQYDHSGAGQTSGTIGEISTTPNAIVTHNDQAVDHTSTIRIRASAEGTTPPADDYTDTITLTVTGGT